MKEVKMVALPEKDLEPLYFAGLWKIPLNH